MTQKSRGNYWKHRGQLKSCSPTLFCQAFLRGIVTDPSEAEQGRPIAHNGAHALHAGLCVGWTLPLREILGVCLRMHQMLRCVTNHSCFKSGREISSFQKSRTRLVCSLAVVETCVVTHLTILEGAPTPCSIQEHCWDHRRPPAECVLDPQPRRGTTPDAVSFCTGTYSFKQQPPNLKVKKKKQPFPNPIFNIYFN